MKIINLLIIEDEESQLSIYEDSIDSFNSRCKNIVQIKQTVCRNFKEGETALLSPFYDAAIIDLNLSTGMELEGRTLVESVYKKIRIPIFIYSGSIAQIDDIPENALLRKRLRTDLLSDILNEILGIFNTGITSFLKPNGIIDQKLSEIFWTNLSKDINLWVSHNNQNTLLRYILAHFQESLDINIDGDFEEYHPAEVYLAPPVKKHLHTGDLIQIADDYYLVLTPACDIVLNHGKDETGEKITFRKAEKMVLAKVKSFDFKTLCLNKKGVVDKGKIKEYVSNKSYRYHYLPPFQNDGGYLIDFQELISKEFGVEHTKIASISSPFIKDIISRFGSYYSRQGQPTFNQDKIVESLFEISKQLT